LLSLFYPRSRIIVGEHHSPIQGHKPYGDYSVTGLINLLYEVFAPPRNSTYNLSTPGLFYLKSSPTFDF